MKKNKLLWLGLLCAALLLCGCDKKTNTPAESNAVTESNGNENSLLYHTDGYRCDALYDAEGRVVERVRFGERCEVLGTTLFSYTEDGTYIKELNNGYEVVSESFCTPEQGTVYNHIYGENAEYRYCYEGGVLAERIDYKDGKPSLSTMYNEKGWQIKSVSYTTAGDVFEYKQYSYNDAGKNTQIDIYDGADALKSSVEYEYTEKGYYASSTTRNGKGEITRRTEYTYDESGKQTAELIYKYEGGVAVSYEKWVTDEDGKRVLEGSYDL